MSSLRSLALLLCALALPAWAGEMALALGSLRHPAFEADELRVLVDTERRGEADVRIGRLSVAGTEYRDLELHCSGFLFDGRQIDCPRGEIHRSDPRGADRPALPFSFSYRTSDGRMELSITGADVTAWSPLIKRLRGWKPQGRTDVRLVADRKQARLTVALRDVSFANKEGDVAAERLAIDLDAEAKRTTNGWDWRAILGWTEGELRLPPWSRQADMKIEAAGRLTGAELIVDLARLDVGGVGSVTAGLRWDRARGEPSRWGLVTERVDLSAALREWLQPWLDTHGVTRFAATGGARFAAEWSDGTLQSFYAGIDDANLVDASGDFELRGFDLAIPWRRGETSEATLNADGGRLGELPLGGFDIPIRLGDERVTLAKLDVPLLDGRLRIDEFAATGGPRGWRGVFSGGIEGVSMPKLTRALKLPHMDGTLTAGIPHAMYEDRRLILDGGLNIEVFDGRIAVTNLQVFEPFRPGQRFLVDVEARNLDLGMLTRTFAFGSIAGRFDADLKGLEMRGGKPVRFIARVASSPGDYPRILSLGALRDITALGEAREGETVARIPERAIGGFGYRRIAIGCTLADGVCLLDGVRKEGDGILLMEGTGVPSVSIVGYNQRIDWEALVARFREVIAGKPGVLIE